MAASNMPSARACPDSQGGTPPARVLHKRTCPNRLCHARVDRLEAQQHNQLQQHLPCPATPPRPPLSAPCNRQQERQRHQQRCTQPYEPCPSHSASGATGHGKGSSTSSGSTSSAMPRRRAPSLGGASISCATGGTGPRCSVTTCASHQTLEPSGIIRDDAACHVSNCGVIHVK